MRSTELITYAETKAEQAESLSAFKGLKLLSVKEKIATLLDQIKNDGFFKEYTRHDITHVNRMLESLDFIIPDETKELLTPTDWLLIVLSIYFHDLGMIITQKEYDKRGESGFVQYKSDVEKGLVSEEFMKKVSRMELPEKERFLYQEYVRRSHGERIKRWLIEADNLNFDQNYPVVAELRNLIENIDSIFIKDLAYVCESHQLEDLEDFEKYKIKRSYGQSQAENANVFYAALILRTADLLHITLDRTPTIEFNIICPSDPKSQEEWAKQRAVRSIKPKDKRNKEGKIDTRLEKDTFEVTALFKKEDGYFALIAYLAYAEEQLKASCLLNELARQQHASAYSFPWKYIDESEIVAENFEKKKFEFILDQNKILELLIGHTLYNDSSVVMRELSQNAIDTVRFKQFRLKGSNVDLYKPAIEVVWEENKRELFFKDNGNGMNLEVIENYLLKVGSSFYQSKDFKEKYSGFSAISRFGIGLLTCFLVADDLDILTKQEGMEKPILLKIRKVHGKYLLKHGSDDADHNLMSPISGTSIRLFIRDGINMTKLEAHLRKWIVFPNCNFTLKHNGQESSIGYKDPQEVLEKWLKSNMSEKEMSRYKVLQLEDSGLKLAFVLRHQAYRNVWGLYSPNVRNSNRDLLPIGTCIEGVRVSSKAPGLDDSSCLILANSTGENALHTNVARSNIEKSGKQIKYLKLVYGLYFRYIKEQTDVLESCYSTSWAILDTNWLIDSLSEARRSNQYSNITNIDIFKDILSEYPNILIEKTGENTREKVTFKNLLNMGCYWTIECTSYSSADSIITEIRGAKSSALDIIKNIYEDNSVTEHLDVVLCPCDYSQITKDLIYERFEVSSLIKIENQRRLDLKWEIIMDSPKWLLINGVNLSRYSKYDNHYIFLQLDDLSMTGIQEEVAINSAHGFFILKQNEIGAYLQKIAIQTDSAQMDSTMLEVVASFIQEVLIEGIQLEIEEAFSKFVGQIRDANLLELINDKLDKQELFSLLQKQYTIYDNSVWYRRL